MAPAQIASEIRQRYALIDSDLLELKLAEQKPKFETMKSLVLEGLELLNRIPADEVSAAGIQTGASIFNSSLDLIHRQAQSSWANRAAETDLSRFVQSLYSSILSGEQLYLHNSQRGGALFQAHPNKFFQSLQTLRGMRPQVAVNPKVSNDISPNVDVNGVKAGIYNQTDLEKELNNLKSDKERVEFLDALLSIEFPSIESDPNTGYLASKEFRDEAESILVIISERSKQFPEFGYVWPKVKSWSEKINDQPTKVLYLSHIVTKYRQQTLYPDMEGPLKRLAYPYKQRLESARAELEHQERLLEHAQNNNDTHALTTSGMPRRYQVFVSSTFEDLKEERRQVIEVLLQLGCFPAAMEWFSGINDDKWNVIEPVINSSDYFIAILAGRYGSGFAEREYDHAVSKGIPVAAFVHSDIGKLPMNLVDSNQEDVMRRDAFHAKVKSKMVKYWDTPENLASSVSASLHSLFTNQPQAGWVKGDNMKLSLHASTRERPTLPQTISVEDVNVQLQKQLLRFQKEYTLAAAYVLSRLPLQKYMITEFYEMMTKLYPAISLGAKGKSNIVTTMWNRGNMKNSNPKYWIAKPVMKKFFKWNDIYDRETASNQILRYMKDYSIAVPDDSEIQNFASLLLRSI